MLTSITKEQKRGQLMLLLTTKIKGSANVNIGLFDYQGTKKKKRI